MLLSALFRVALALAALSVMASAAMAQPPAKGFRAGAYAIDVTPERFPVVVNGMFTERTAAAAHDRLHARCLALDDGTTRVVLAIVDSLMMPRELLDEVKEAVRQATGIPTGQQLIAATHTHSAPSVMGCLGSDRDPHYPLFLQAQLVRAITKAVGNLAPARVGWVVAPAPEHTHNRRWILRPDRLRADPFGAKTVRANMHPGYQSPDFIGPSGPVDADLSLLAVQAADGRPVAVLANYSMHYFGSAPVSADYFGAFVEKFTRRVTGGKPDPAFVAMMSQGTSGDLMWMDYGRAKSALNLDRYAEGLAQIAHDAYRRVTYRDGLTLAMQEAKLPLGRRAPDAARLAWANKLVATFKDRKPKTQPEIYAREQVFLHQEPRRELKLQALRIGELGITAIPNEVFALTGLKLKAFSPLRPTFTIELANGAEGYIPPPEQHHLGGYTTWPARTAGLEVEAEPKIVEAVLGLLEGVSGKPRRPFAEPPSVAAQQLLAAKPVAYWRLGELHGPVAADTAGRHPGTYEPGVAFHLEGPQWARPSAGESTNRGPHFAGGRVRATLKDLGTTYTVSLWFWNGLPADARPVTGYLFARGREGTAGAIGDHLGLGGTQANAGRLFFSTGKERGQTLAGKTEIKPRTWHHVALVRDGRRAAVYLDGKLEMEGQTEATALGGVGQFFLGGRSDNTANWEGRLDEVAVFDRALTADDIARHCTAPGASER